jgi:hypothetical protein
MPLVHLGDLRVWPWGPATHDYGAAIEQNIDGNRLRAPLTNPAACDYGTSGQFTSIRGK